MGDRLNEAILTALANRPNDKEFELCAVELLRPLYPRLVWVPGGSDFGADAYSDSEPPDETPVLMVATTSERGLDNLRKNLKTYKVKEGRAQRVIFATSRVLSATKRRNLRKAATGEGFSLIQEFDRNWFVQQLYGRPDWRMRLLGIPGDTPALSSICPSRRPSVDLPLFGRDSELSILRNSKGDLVVVGEPGAGKTAILRELVKEGWGLFVADSNTGNLADAIREERPKRIILDDAHFDVHLLTQLRHLREEMDVKFAIVAVTWPGQKDTVRANLLESKEFHIRLLPRDIIVEIVKEVGVIGPVDFQRSLVDQARGRPGLAATLALLAVRGAVKEAVSGEALFKETVTEYSRLVDKSSGAVLGVIALSGDGGIDLESIAAVLRLDLAMAHELLRGLASGGTIDEARWGKHKVVIQPEVLRYWAVKEVFFGPGPLPVEHAIQRLSEPHNAAVPLIGAAHRGARVENGLIQFVLGNDPPDSALRAYATLGVQQAQYAAQLKPAAAAAIAGAALDHSPRWAYGVLMESALGDDRPRHSSPDHPMRVISDSIGAVEAGAARRRELFYAARDYVSDGGAPNLAVEALSYSVSPKVSWLQNDPGLGRKVTIYQGTLRRGELEKVSAIWRDVCSLMPIEGCTDYGPLLETLTDWAYAGRLSRGQHDPDILSYMRSVTRSVVRDLAERMQDHPGVLARLLDLSRDNKLRLAVPVPEDFRALFPRDRFREDYQSELRRLSKAARRFAERLSKLPAKEIARRLISAERSASEAGIGWPRLTPDVCRELATARRSVDGLIRELIARDAPADLVHSVLDAVEIPGSRLSRGLLENLFENESYRRGAIMFCLARDVGDKLQSKAVAQVDASMRMALEFLALRKELDATVLSGLLDHPDRVVAGTVAVHARGYIKELGPEARRKWEKALVRCRGGRESYWLGVTLRDEPALLVRWLKGWIIRQRQDDGYELLPTELEGSIRELPGSIKRELLMDSTSAPKYRVDGLVRLLVGDDLETAKSVFGEPKLAKYKETILAGRPSPTWLERARMALADGFDPDLIVYMAHLFEMTWSGEESMHWAGWVTDFESLPADDEESRRIRNAGIEMYSQMRDRAVEREEREGIFGDS